MELSQQILSEITVTKNSTPPWGPLGYITFKRTYARKLKDSENTEEFDQAIDRVIKACRTQLEVGFSEQEEQELYSILFNLKGSVAGRFWWQLGTKTVDKLGLLSLQNCAATLVNDPIRPFTWTMDALMLGSGVGYNIQRQYVNQLPKLKGKIKIERKDTKDADFIVPDSREGWIKLLAKTLKAHFYSGEGFTYSTLLIRGNGAPITGFGGTASGPEILCTGISQIHDILNGRAKKKLRPIDCLDIMNIIGSIVVAGNVRRSAQIAIGDPDDIEFLKAKRWDLGPIPNWRAMSNNSVACDNLDDLAPEFWQTYQQGEPYGLINIGLSRKIGRVGETQYPDPDVVCYNPCAEQNLADKETCCLADVFLPKIESKEELFKVVRYLYRICKHSLTLPCHLKETEEIVHRNMRMGIGMTGIYQASEQQRSWLNECYQDLREFDKQYSEKKGFPTSIKLTTVKPSGTLSLLPGVTPGAHPSPAGPYYIRRIRIASNSPLVQVCKNHGYFVEYCRRFDGTNDPSTVVVEFPCSVPEYTPIGGNLTAISQLEFVKNMQTVWSDNAVSVTVYYKKEEIELIQQWLKDNYQNCVKSVSFLLYHGHGFDQAPYETISKERYEELIVKVKPITSVEVQQSDLLDSFECEGGACPIK
jgi:ribonucleoside-triphosphate reductase